LRLAYDMISYMKTQQGSKPSIAIYIAVFFAHIKKGQLDEGLELLYEITEIGGTTANLNLYNHVIDGYKKLGQHDKAFQVVEVMKQRGIKPSEEVYRKLNQ